MQARALVCAASLTRLEDLLSIALPCRYRDFLCDYPDDTPYEVRTSDLFSDPHAIAEETRAFRESHGDGPDARRWLVIGTLGDGDRICLDLDTDRVVFWSRDEDHFEPIATDIRAYYRIAAAELI